MEMRTWYACFVLFLNAAFAQVQSGTTVVINKLDDKIMVAADSRGFNENGPPDDCECKIAALGKYTIYAAAGNVNYTTLLGDEWSSWKSSDDAREAYRSLISQEGKPDFVNLVAEEWDRRLVHHWSLVYKRKPKDVVKYSRIDGILVRGFFGGTDPSGTKLVALFTNITFDPNRFQPVAATEPAENESGNFWTMGLSEVVYEFFIPQSDRARLERTDRRKMLGSNPLDADIWEIAWLVQLQITYHIPEGGLTAISEVGGSVDALKLQKGKGVQWFRRKSNCPP